MKEIIQPQAGSQMKALSCGADIMIYGGSAGGGKTFVLLLEACRNVDNPEFGATIFRRTSPQITNKGGLWDASRKIYTHLNAIPKQSPNYNYRFESGATVDFGHLQYDDDVLNYQGSEIPLLCFDELPHFSEYQFFYMLSRNRSTCGVTPYVRASCNPDPDSWVRSFIDWWIGEDGFPIPERDGVLRYMRRYNDIIYWADSKKELIDSHPELFANDPEDSNPLDFIKSVTFIRGSIHDNKILLKIDPQYLGNLNALPEADRMKLLDGNWNIRVDGMGIFEHNGINDLFSNEISQITNAEKYITCDAARFGRDFCTILVWKGWEVIYTVIFYQSDAHDITGEIEKLRNRFNIRKSHVLIDQDGVGGNTVALGGYEGFSGGLRPMADPETFIVENYKNLKTQCCYRFAEKRVNRGEVKWDVNSDTVMLFEVPGKAGIRTTKVKVEKLGVIDIKELIRADLRSFKRDKTDMDGKICMIPKAEQKEILKGRSPDFGDPLYMREWFELKPKANLMRKRN